MATFKFRSTQVEAYRLAPYGIDENMEAFATFCEQTGFNGFTSGRDESMEINYGDEGNILTAMPGDWIVKLSDSLFIPVPPDKFGLLFAEVSGT